MSWLRARVLPISGVLCLAGQGTLLYRAGIGPDAPRLPLPGLFLTLTVLQLLLLYFDNRRHRGSRSGDASDHRTWARGLTFAAAAALLVVAWMFTTAAGPGSTGAGLQQRSDSLLENQERLTELVPALRRFAAAALGALDNPGFIAETPRMDGRYFRALEGLPASWTQAGSAAAVFPLRAVLWRSGERIGWTSGSDPLAPPEPSRQDTLTIAASGGRWYLRHLAPTAAGGILELQVPLGQGETGRLLPGVRLDVAAGLPTGAKFNEAGDPVVAFTLADDLAEATVVLTAEPDETGSRLRSRRALSLLLGMFLWTVVLAGFGRINFGPVRWLVALWAGRALLASAETLSWVSAAFPDEGFPAAPSSVFSLIDPAYFATPFAAGWFASVADAMLTVLLLVLTAWHVVRSGGAGTRLRALADRLARRGAGPLGALVFGLLVGGVLLWLRFFAGLLAENANARLIGTGASLSFLSFWGLQVVLVGMTFALGAPLARWAGAGSWPRRGQGRRWLIAAVLAGAAAGLVSLVVPALWSSGRILAGFVAAGLWAVAPALRARPRFVRRFAWPAVLLLGVIWNYACLREVYDAAERNWMERKGSVITQADQEWTRYLLGSVLEEMRLADTTDITAPVPGAEVWSDEPAWDLWDGSALRDLGYACLVEIVDSQSGQESLFARGFMRDFQYEVVDRSAWVDEDGLPPDDNWNMIFQTERRTYSGGEEEIVAAEIVRSAGRGWIRIELPVRSWRISTLMADLGTAQSGRANGYRPRAEVDRPVLLLLADDSGWLAAGESGFPDPSADALLAELQAGSRDWAVLPVADEDWLCRWNPLPPRAARTAGEGFLVGLRRPGFGANVLDLSRLMLLHLTLAFIFIGALHLARRFGNVWESQVWRPGFQERFLAGYLFLGLVLLLVVGMSVDRVGNVRIREEARSQTREGLNLAVKNLRSLLVEQARSLAGSEYIADLLIGQLRGQRPLGPVEMRQGMVFAADGSLLLDETLSDLSDAEARALLAAGRQAPLVIIRDEEGLFVGTVIPLDLEGFLTVPESEDVIDPGHGETATSGFFLYRQRFAADLLGGLADLAQGQATLRLDGMPVLASHPATIFAGEDPLLGEPALMSPLFDHPTGSSAFAAPGRPFAFAGAQPLPAFARDGDGRLKRRIAPAVLSLGFPDREREFEQQRRGTILFLAGLANLILLTALVLALLMSWNIFRPLRVLLGATRSLAQGDFSAPLPEAGEDEIGRLAGAFGLMRGELQTARDRLAARERFLSTVLDRVTVGVAVLDRNEEVVVLNPAGRTILASFGPWDATGAGVTWLLQGFRELAAGRDRPQGELKSRDGRKTLRGAMAPLDLPDGRTDTMLVFEDITEFLDNKKMAINAELARQVAHEIKNPLTPIQLSVQLLSQAWRDQHPRLDSIVTETVDRVLDQVTLLRSIASEFSLLGRPGELEAVPVDLAAMTAEVIAAYGAGAERPGTAAMALPTATIAGEDPPLVLAHRESLQKILGNLMQNSLDAARDEQGIVIDISWRIDDQSVTLIWSDNGTGLPAEVADRLFDPYFSTKSKGTGLGLVICRNLADRMGGSISLANRSDGRGAIAEVKLPRADGAPAATED